MLVRIWWSGLFNFKMSTEWVCLLAHYFSWHTSPVISTFGRRGFTVLSSLFGGVWPLYLRHSHLLMINRHRLTFSSQHSMRKINNSDAAILHTELLRVMPLLHLTFFLEHLQVPRWKQKICHSHCVVLTVWRSCPLTEYSWCSMSSMALPPFSSCMGSFCWLRDSTPPAQSRNCIASSRPPSVDAASVDWYVTMTTLLCKPKSLNSPYKREESA